MTEERKLCPFSMAIASLREGAVICVEEKCMAWQPEEEMDIAEKHGNWVTYGGTRVVPGHCRLIP